MESRPSSPGLLRGGARGTFGTDAPRASRPAGVCRRCSAIKSRVTVHAKEFEKVSGKVQGQVQTKMGHKTHDIEPTAQDSRVSRILLLRRRGLENGAFPPTLQHTREHSVGSWSVSRGRVRYLYCSKQA